jgi:hypothetical protein
MPTARFVPRALVLSLVARLAFLRRVRAYAKSRNLALVLSLVARLVLIRRVRACAKCRNLHNIYLQQLLLSLKHFQ